MSDISSNPPLSPWVRIFTGAALVVLIAGPFLLFAPQVISPRWPWAIPPFNARFLGAIYVAELGSMAIMFVQNRWSPGRAAILAAFIFTFVVSVASFFHMSSFVGFRRVVLWFILYVGYAMLTALALLAYRNLPRVAVLPISESFRRGVNAAGVLMILYGALLFFAPTFAAGFWPWGIDALHGQIYSAVFIAPGAALLLLARQGAREEYLVAGMFIGGLGLFAILGFLLAHLQTGRANFASPGTWLWVLIFACLFALGLAMIRASRAKA